MRNIALFAALALTTACVEGDKDEPAAADGVVITWTHDPAAQRHSYALLAEEFALAANC